MEILLFISFLLFTLAREYMAFKEREKLLDRIMADNLHEFKHVNEEVEENVFTTPLPGTDLDEAKEEIIGEQNDEEE